MKVSLDTNVLLHLEQAKLLHLLDHPQIRYWDLLIPISVYRELESKDHGHKAPDYVVKLIKNGRIKIESYNNFQRMRHSLVLGDVSKLGDGELEAICITHRFMENGLSKKECAVFTDDGDAMSKVDELNMTVFDMGGFLLLCNKHNILTKDEVTSILKKLRLEKIYETDHEDDIISRLV